MTASSSVLRPHVGVRAYPGNYYSTAPRVWVCRGPARGGSHHLLRQLASKAICRLSSASVKSPDFWI